MLFKQKENFYKINKQDESIVEVEKIRLKNILKSGLNLESIYYNLDDHNLFKRIDRYYHNRILLITFSMLSALNLFEIVFNIYFFIDKKNSDQFNKELRIATIFPNIIYIFLIQFLATFLVVKKKVETSIYY